MGHAPANKIYWDRLSVPALEAYRDTKVKESDKKQRAMIDTIILFRKVCLAAHLNPHTPPELAQMARNAIFKDRRVYAFTGGGTNLCNRCQRPKEGYEINCKACKEYEPQDQGLDLKDKPKAQARSRRSEIDACPICGNNKTLRAKMCRPCRSENTNNVRGKAPNYFNHPEEE